MKESFLSVGIDIGTSTTQVIFSRITIENSAGMYSVPRINIVDKSVAYQSEIYLTPLLSETEIDEVGIRRIVETEYKKAGVAPGDVATGAVIITGETARKENAGRALQAVSGLAGEFVVATAGPALEGIIAGKGAGAAELSLRLHKPVANLDIGGGTTNIALFVEGEPVDTSCLDIGGRLIKLGQNRKITYLAPKLRELCGAHGVRLNVGESADSNVLIQACDLMADCLPAVLGFAGDRDRDVALLLTDHALETGVIPAHFTISGGVGHCLLQPLDSDFPYGDVGVLLARSIKRAFAPHWSRLLQPKETIRATVIGSGMYSTEISGSTITYSPHVLPVKSAPIVKLPLSTEKSSPDVFAAEALRMLSWYDLKSPVALSICGEKNIRFDALTAYARCVIAAMKPVIDSPLPLIVVIEEDMAKALGQALQVALPGKDIICVDSVNVAHGDYIDIGRPLMNGRVLPVVIKTLALA